MLFSSFNRKEKEEAIEMRQNSTDSHIISLFINLDVIFIHFIWWRKLGLILTNRFRPIDRSVVCKGFNTAHRKFKEYKNFAEVMKFASLLHRICKK